MLPTFPQDNVQHAEAIEALAQADNQRGMANDFDGAVQAGQIPDAVTKPDHSQQQCNYHPRS